jgi:hypothetical protein
VKYFIIIAFAFSWLVLSQIKTSNQELSPHSSVVEFEDRIVEEAKYGLQSLSIGGVLDQTVRFLERFSQFVEEEVFQRFRLWFDDVGGDEAIEKIRAYYRDQEERVFLWMFDRCLEGGPIIDRMPWFCEYVFDKLEEDIEEIIIQNRRNSTFYEAAEIFCGFF